MKTGILSLLVGVSMLSSAFAAEDTRRVVYEGSIDIAHGQPVAYPVPASGSPYQGRYLYRVELLSQDRLPLRTVLSGAGDTETDPETSYPGRPYCWTQMVFDAGSFSVTLYNEDNGVKLGSYGAPIEVSVLSTHDYDGKCDPRPRRDSGEVTASAAQLFAQSNLAFDVQLGVRLQTRLLVAAGTAQLVEGELVGFELKNPTEQVLEWSAWDPTLSTSQEKLESKVSGRVLLSRGE